MRTIALFVFLGCGGACFVAADGEDTGPATCNTVEDCPSDGDPCQRAVCYRGSCLGEPAPDGVVADQVAADCKTRACRGGALVDEDDPSDDDDSRICTVDMCGPGGATHVQQPDGSACMIGAATGVCQGEADCVIECSMTKPCPTAGPCLVSACVDNICVYTPVDGDPSPPLPDGVDGDCQRPTCAAGREASVADASDLPPDDGLPCTDDTCVAGAPAHPPVALGTPCGNGLTCDAAGVCAGCSPADPTSCGVATACTTPTCDPGTFSCSDLFDPPHTACSGGVCKAGGLCVECVDETECAPSQECAYEACEADACVAHAVHPGDPCRLSPSKLCDIGGVCVECLAAVDCGAPPPCHDASCGGGQCQFPAQPDDKPCPSGVCFQGACVACNRDADCGGSLVCCNHVCKAAPC